MQIDAVITWVNGGDADWRAKRQHHSREPQLDLLPSSNGEGRYRDNDDLLFLLRSMEKFWGIDGNIFIVTDQQIPGFIADHPRLRIVDHSEILAEHYLPTFSRVLSNQRSTTSPTWQSISSRSMTIKC